MRAGPLAYMARHGVAANLLMLVLLLGGLLAANRLTQEVFPDFELDRVSVSLALPGAAPGEVERGAVLAVEAALADVRGVSSVSARVREGSATLTAELSGARDRRIVLGEIEQAVARIDSFPEELETPDIRLAARDDKVMELTLHGQVDRRGLRMAAERLRDGLAARPGISRVEIDDARPFELAVEVPSARLRALGLTLDDIARIIRASARDLGAGGIETRRGDILLRLEARRAVLAELRAVPIVTDRGGTLLRLGEIATLEPVMAETGTLAWFDGRPAVTLSVIRSAGETPVSLSRAVRAALPGLMAELPEALGTAITLDRSEIFEGRMDLLVTNGLIGLCLVLILLGLFLEARLAFWVAMGIPTAFLGSFFLLAAADASINMLTMFAFILALGIVVDDAIVVGESVHAEREGGLGPEVAAITGARAVAVPLAFSILTNIVAFLPLAMIPDGFGRFFVWIPIVVASAFLMSWLEALFVLPAHLAALRPRARARRAGPAARFARLQRTMSAGLEAVIARGYAPLLRLALRWRYVTVAAMLGAAMVVMAVPLSGGMGYSLFPPIPRDSVSLRVVLPVDAPEAVRERVRGRIAGAAEAVVARMGGEALSRGVSSGMSDNTVTAEVHLTPPGTRPVQASEVARAWRAEVGALPEARAERYRASFGGPGGESGLSVRLSHPDSRTLRAAADRLVDGLAGFAAVRDPEDGFSPGKPERSVRLTEAGRALGLTAQDVGAELRAGFLGTEALSRQDGSREVTLRVRLPEEERDDAGDIARLPVALPDGGWVALGMVATVTEGRAAGAITRRDGRRSVTVTANVSPDSASAAIAEALETRLLPTLAAEMPGLSYRFGGRQEASRETTRSFTRVSVPLALGLMFTLLAVLFRSYWQPVVVLAAIPFGAVGAVIGHMIMGMSLSMVSVFGMIALSGVVINAAIVMLDLANRLRAEGAAPFEAIRAAGVRRFRPILLTTLTTFGGLAPMIFETSAQARFLVPMAVSLGYGILFATLIVMLFVPALYLVGEDIRWLARPARAGVRAA